MIQEKQWNRAICLVIAGFSFEALIALVKIFYAQADVMVFSYSNLVFVISRVIFSIIHGFLIYLFFLFPGTSLVRLTKVNLALRFSISGLFAAILLRFFHIIYYLSSWSFWQVFFFDAVHSTSILFVFLPLSFFFYHYYQQMKPTQDRRLAIASSWASIGAGILVLGAILSLLAVYFPSLFSWFFTIENSPAVTIPRFLAYLSCIFFFFSLHRTNRKLRNDR